MKYAHSMFAHLKKIPLLYYIAGAVAVALVWFFFFNGSKEVIATSVLEPKPFLQEVSVSGRVTASSEVDLGFSQGGRITGVNVRVGQFVGRGAVLASTENGDLRAALLQRQAALEMQEAKLAALKAGTRPEEVAVAEATVEKDSVALIDEINDAYRVADAAVRNTTDQFISNPRVNPSLNFLTSDNNYKAAVENKRLAMESLLSIWSGQVTALSGADDLAAAAVKAQSNLSAVASYLSDANAALNRAIATTAMPQSTIEGYISAVATARTNVNAAVSAVSSAYAALDSSRKNLALKQAGSTSQDIAAQEAQVKAARADVAAAQAQLNKTVITAPFAGTITVVDAKVGKIVSPNTPEISMIGAGAFQIESYVPEINIALLKVGNKATATLDAYGDTKFGATVVSLDPAETVRDGVSTYRAVLQFDKTDTRVKSGMTANVSIVTDEKEGALSVPQGLIIRKGGASYVRIMTGETMQEREVTLGGVSSLGEVEILSGLSRGDIIVTTLP